jgi:hypothetical protein
MALRRSYRYCATVGARDLASDGRQNNSQGKTPPRRHPSHIGVVRVARIDVDLSYQRMRRRCLDLDGDSRGSQTTRPEKEKKANVKRVNVFTTSRRDIEDPAEFRSPVLGVTGVGNTRMGPIQVNSIERSLPSTSPAPRERLDIAVGTLWPTRVNVHLLFTDQRG